MLKEFRQFILRGNVVDLGVGIVVGSAFTAVVNSFVRDLLTPLLAAIGGQPNFSNLAFTVHGSRFLYGDFINAVVSFLIMATVIFFLVVAPITHLKSATQRSRKTEDPSNKKCPECLSEIPIKATRCAFCTIEIANNA